MQWNRSNTIGISKMSCARCQGNGTRLVRYGHETACNCAYRAAFRACFNRFRECSAQGAHASTVSLDLVQGPRGKCVFSRKCEEYTADFCLVSRRVLDEFNYKIFRYHFVLGADWKLCCQQLKIDRGTFFHAIYRIEQILGRAFADLQPYALYPPDEYFSGAPYNGSRPKDPLPALLPKAA